MAEVSRMKEALRAAHAAGDDAAARRLASMIRSAQGDGQRPDETSSQFLARQQETQRAPKPVEVLGVRLPGDTRGALGGFGEQLLNNLGVGDEMAGVGAYVRQGVDNLGRAVTGKPQQIEPADAYEAAANARKSEAERYRQESPVGDALATVGGIAIAGAPATAKALSLANPFKAAYWTQPVVMQKGADVAKGALKFGAQMTGVQAPFILARQEGDALERLNPEAAKEGALTFALSVGTKGLSDALTRGNPEVTRRLAEFDAAGVRPTLAAVNATESGGVAKAVSENVIAGKRARDFINRSLDDTRVAADALADRAGEVSKKQAVGERVQKGIEKFNAGKPAPGFAPDGGVLQRFYAARAVPTKEAGSLQAKSNAMYEALFDRIENIEKRRANAWAKQNGSIPRPSDVTIKNTRKVLGEIDKKVSAPSIASLVKDADVGRILSALEQDASQLRFRDLRELRTWVRELQSTPQLRQGVDEAGLQRIERALTLDLRDTAGRITANSDEINGARQMDQIDRYYKAGVQRVEEALQPFANEKSGEAVYGRIIRAASDKSSGNAKQLLQLKRSLPPEDWGSVRATIISNLGRTRPGAANALEEDAFSINNFVSNYATLSEDGRRILFGGYGGGGKEAEDLFQALQTLTKVAGYQKGVEAGANASRSAVNAQNVLTIGAGGAAVVNPQLWAPLAGFMASNAVAGELLTNPAFVRWLASAPQAGQSVGGMRAHVARLGVLAGANPALQPLYAELLRSTPEPVAPSSLQSQKAAPPSQ
jgi:hypothetical protein